MRPMGGDDDDRKIWAAIVNNATEGESMRLTGRHPDVDDDTGDLFVIIDDVEGDDGVGRGHHAEPRSHERLRQLVDKEIVVIHANREKTPSTGWRGPRRT